MKRPIFFLLVFLIVSLISAGTLQQDQSEKDKRDTVLDRVTHIEKDLYLEVPKVPRLCDQLDLKKQRINVGDCEFYVEEEGKGLPIVLLHGGPGATHHYFHPYFSRARDFAKVIYYDQRGCGISGYCPGKGGYTVDQAANDLDNLRKALKIDRWVVLGHSYGGLLAQYYSLKYPDALAGLVLVGASEGMHVPLKPTRQYDFFSAEEKARMKEIRVELGKLLKDKKLSQEKFIELLVYNNFLNGDWKRQNFYKPSKERFAQIALYEWKQDTDFNGIMSQDSDKIDLQGAFEGCPVPTIILEGKWDLTWNTDKPEVLQKNHPSSRLVMFEYSSHSPFEDEPERFFPALKDFMKSLPQISPAEISGWRQNLVEWKKKQEASLSYILRSTGDGRKSNEKIAGLYSKEWLEKLQNPDELLKTAFALYDMTRHEDGLAVFKKMYDVLQKGQENKFYSAVALIWEGFMLDLLSRRDEAISVYQKVVAMDIHDNISHDQFGLSFAPSAYAAEKIREPFKRIENKLKD
jgi:proline iminopeptidase